MFKDFCLFLRSLSCIGSSGRLVGRISPKFRPNPPKWHRWTECKGNTMIFVPVDSGVPDWSTLELNNQKFGPKILMPRVICFLKPAPQVWKSKSRSNNLGFYVLSRKDQIGFQVFLVVCEVPELYRKLRETCGKNSRYVSSKSELLVPSYYKKKKNVDDHKSNDYFNVSAFPL